MLAYYFNFLPLVLFLMLPFLLFAKRRQDNQRWTHSLNDRLLRSAGDSTLEAIERLNVKLTHHLKWIGVAVSIQVIGQSLLGTFASGRLHGLLLPILSALTVASLIWHLATVIFALIKRSQQIAHYHGERIVGEHLKLLIIEGYRVFHDLQFDSFNIDHAVVGPGGVFAIETLVRQPRKADGASPSVGYDGEYLKWYKCKPHDEAITRAFERSQALQGWLTGRIPQPLPVIPLLVIPGWKIDGERKGKVNVVNPKFLANFFQTEENYTEVLESAVIKRISQQFLEKSRTQITDETTEKADCEEPAFERKEEESPLTV